LRRSGIAKALKIRSEQWAKNSGLDHIHTWVHVDNAKMISMNKIMGYKTTILKMRKDLTSMTKEFTSEVIKKEIPTLQLPRLTLRPFTVADAKDVQRQAGNIKVSSMTASIPHPYPDGVAEIWISKHQGRYNEGKCVDWAIQLNENKKLIGNISWILNKAHHRAEIGYWIGEEYWNKGYCSEAARAAINFAFKELGLTKVIGRHVAENTASGKVMINAGMKQEGYFAKDFFKDGQFLDMILYGVIQN
jgi:ribosomal-protein-alanine N-acetyltransferase